MPLFPRSKEETNMFVVIVVGLETTVNLLSQSDAYMRL